MSKKSKGVNSLEPAIYVACLASYNAGCLHGCWISANQPIENIQSEISQMLAKSPESGSEEWAIHDYDNFGSIHLHEYTDIETIVEMAKIIEEYGELGSEVVAYHSNDLDEANRMLQEEYCGEYDSEEEYARQLVSDCYDVPESLECYIDYKKFCSDLMMDYYSIYLNGKYHVFRHC